MTKANGIVKAPWMIARDFPRPSYDSTLTIKAPATHTLDQRKEKRLIEASFLAIDMVARAQKTLANYGENSPQRVKDLLEMIFASDFLGKDHRIFQELQESLATIHEGLTKDLTLKVVFPPLSRKARGYVHMRDVDARQGTYAIKRTDVLHHLYGRRKVFGNIHLANELLNGSHRIHDVARTIVHEASHRYCATVDHQYLKRDFNVLRYKYMTPEKALKNADSFARFCQYLTVPHLEVRQPLAVEGKSQGLNFMNGRTRC